jgi:NADH:ubiquinone oxidoreductase subunit E
MKKSLEKILKNFDKKDGNILPTLQEVQESYGYIPEEVVNWFSKKLDIPASRIFGIITFYPQFLMKPRGENVIVVCRGTACHVNGSEKILNRLLMELGIPDKGDTTKDLKFTVEKANCIGACGVAPVVIINNVVQNKMTINKLIQEIKTLKTK